MNHEDLDRLLEQGLSGDPPRPEFREQVLQSSTATFVRRRRERVLWRATALSAAAVLIAGVSFLLGRASLIWETPRTAAVPTRVATGDQTVAVPSDLVAWLEAARFFRQLGMEDRMARAVDHASKLLPYDTATAGGATGPVVAASGRAVESRRDYVGPGRRAGLPESVESMKRILAQSLGD